MRIDSIAAGALGLGSLLAAPAAAQTQASLRASVRVMDTRIPEAAAESAGRLVRDDARAPDAATMLSRATGSRRDTEHAGVFLDRSACDGAGDCPEIASVLVIYW